MDTDKPVFGARPSRRRLLGMGAVCAAGLALRPAASLARPMGPRKLSFLNLHTGERLTTAFWSDGALLSDGLAEINRVLRDHRTGEVMPIDPGLLDMLHRLQQRMETTKPFHVISGYRSPKTNAALRKNGGGVAKRSYHMKGMAIDIRLPGHRLSDLRKAALSLRGGGVGYYPKSGFIHVDTGPVRQWS